MNGFMNWMEEKFVPVAGKIGSQRHLAAIIPGFIVLMVFGTVAYLLGKTETGNLFDIVFNLIQKLLMGITQGMAAVILMPIIMNFLWFFGVHGANIFEPIMQSVYLPALSENAAAIEAGGLFKGVRTIPIILEIADEINELAPDAWLINFTNPVGMVMEALIRYSKHRKFVGLCNVPISQILLQTKGYARSSVEGV